MEPEPRAEPVDHPRPRRRGRRLAVVAAVLVGLLVVGAGAVAVSDYRLLDEWTCSDGEEPARNAAGGGECFAKGATLPAGYEREPLGRRPSHCRDRRGWIEVVDESSDELDCLKQGRDMPDGYHRATDADHDDA